MTPPANHPAIVPPKIGVLLMNLGTPDAPDAKSVKRYLGEFLSDRRVVEIPQIAWQPILRGIILQTRPKKSAHAYGLVWREDGSPLAAITKAQSIALQGAFGADVMVDWAMRYGNPSIPDRIAAMKAAGCERILLAPLYPQYCAATTATANDKAFAQLATMRWQPAIRTLPPYYDAPDYIDALKHSVAAGLAALDFEPDALLASFHGMPQRTLELGDPYHCHCQKDRAAARRGTDGCAGGATARHRVSVAFRTRAMAPARDRRDARGDARARNQEGRGDRAGLFGRLSRDARGIGDPWSRKFHRGRRDRFRLSSLS